MIEDQELAEKIARTAYRLREVNQNVGNRKIRHAIDECLTIVYLLAKDGHLRNMNAGQGNIGRCIARVVKDDGEEE